MKKSILYFLTAIMLFVVSCSESYDDSALVGRVDNLENRVAKLEELCKQMNTNISSLQTLVNALQNNDYITGVTPITKNGETIGYTITFTKSQPITIYHGEDGKNGQNGADGKDGADGTNGKDGQDGHTPVIGVKQDIDGIYYWTIDGDWLLDDAGNKIKAQGTDGKDGANGKDGQDGADGKDGVDGTDGKDGADGADGKDGQDGADGKDGEDGVDGVNGTDGKDGVDGTDGKDGENGKDGIDGTDGKDGITPQLKIENDYWYISYDNGKTWTQLGKATGEDGQDGVNGTNGTNGIDGVDGDSFFQSVTQDENNVYFTLADGTTLTLPKQTSLSISFDEADLVVMSPNSTRKIGYTVTSSSESVKVEVTSSADIKAKAVSHDNTGLAGYIEVKTSETIDEYSKVIVFVHNENKVIMKTILFEKPGLQVYDNNEKYVTSDGGDIELDFMSNMQCEVIIPESAQEWLYTVPDTRALSRQTLIVKARSNDNAERSAVVKIQTIDGELSLDYTIKQLAQSTTNANNEIHYTTTDGNVVKLKTTDGFGATFVANNYNSETNSGVITFATDVESIPDAAFQASVNLSIIELPNTITSIGENAFYGCVAMQKIVIPKSVLTIGESAFEMCKGEAVIKCNIPDFGFSNSGFDKVIIGDNVTQMGKSAFKRSLLKSVYIPSSIKIISEEAFEWCEFLKNIELEYGITTIMDYAFSSTCVEYIKLPNSISEIHRLAFAGCGNLHTIDMPNEMTAIGEMAFLNCFNLKEFRIPNGITRLYNTTFSKCNSLNKLYIPKSVTQSSCAFDCESLERCDIEDWDTWCNLQLISDFVMRMHDGEYSPFAGSTNGGDYYIDGEKLTSVTMDIPNIRGGLFCGCRSLETVILTDNVVSIGDGAFAKCWGLKHIDLPNSIVSIEQCAFYESALEEIVFPKHVEIIPQYCLYGSHNLKSVTFPANVAKIDICVLSDCEKLQTVYCQNPIPPLFDNTNELPSTTKIYVPKESVELYKQKDGWNKFANQIEGYEF